MKKVVAGVLAVGVISAAVAVIAKRYKMCERRTY